MKPAEAEPASLVVTHDSLLHLVWWRHWKWERRNDQLPSRIKKRWKWSLGRPTITAGSDFWFLTSFPIIQNIQVKIVAGLWVGPRGSLKATASYWLVFWRISNFYLVFFKIWEKKFTRPDKSMKTPEKKRVGKMSKIFLLINYSGFPNTCWSILSSSWLCCLWGRGFHWRMAFWHDSHPNGPGYF